MKIGLVFSAMPSNVPTWPYIGYNYEKRAKFFLSLIKENFPELEFIDKIIYNTKEAEEFLERTKDHVVGYIVVLLGIWNNVPYTIIKSERPTILIDDLFAGSGEFLLTLSRARREGYPVIGIATSNLTQVIDTIKLMKALGELKNSKIIMVSEWTAEKLVSKIKNRLGVDIIRVSPSDLNEEYNKVSDNEAKKWKDLWIKKSLEVVEPSEKEILKSAKLYIAMKNLMKKYNAIGITIDCLGLFYKKKLPAYPCLGFVQLLNDSFIAACEADLDSAITQLVIQLITGRPGFISDPVIDEGSNTVTYAHCLATTKPYGKDGIMVPYKIRSHSEDRKGASLQAYWPPGEKVTTIKFSIAEEAMAIHSGIIKSNIEEEKGCRTKVMIATDAEKILNNWNSKVNFSWHRVTVLGDFRQSLINFARLIRFKVIEEDK